jgi:hypothetical protein
MEESTGVFVMLKLPLEFRNVLVEILERNHKGQVRWQLHEWIDDFEKEGANAKHFAEVSKAVQEFFLPIIEAVLPIVCNIAPAITGALQSRIRYYLDGDYLEEIEPK